MPRTRHPTKDGLMNTNQRLHNRKSKYVESQKKVGPDRPSSLVELGQTLLINGGENIGKDCRRHQKNSSYRNFFERPKSKQNRKGIEDVFHSITEVFLDHKWCTTGDNGKGDGGWLMVASY